MKPEIVVAHAVDTEGPLYESVNAKFERLQEIFGIDIKERTPKTFDALLNGEIDVEIPLENREISTQLAKFGAIIGDNSEIGCNAVVCPGALMGKDNWIYPNCTVPKGFHPPGHFIAPANHKPISRLK